MRARHPASAFQLRQAESRFVVGGAKRRHAVSCAMWRATRPGVVVVDVCACDRLRAPCAIARPSKRLHVQGGRGGHGRDVDGHGPFKGTDEDGLAVDDVPVQTREPRVAARRRGSSQVPCRGLSSDWPIVRC